LNNVDFIVVFFGFCIICGGTASPKTPKQRQIHSNPFPEIRHGVALGGVAKWRGALYNPDASTTKYDSTLTNRTGSSLSGRRTSVDCGS
jgi:hypothetical protein